MRPASTTDHLAPDDDARAVASIAEENLGRPQTATDFWWHEPSSPHDADGDNFVELKVLLTDEAYECLESVSEATGDNRTDLVNRALVIYAAMHDAVARGGGSVTFRSRRGQKHRAVIA